MRQLLLTLIVAGLLTVALALLGLASYSRPDSWIGWIVSVAWAPLVGPTVWVADLMGIELQSNLLVHLVAGSLLWSIFLVSAGWLRRTSHTDRARARGIAVGTLSLIVVGAIYMHTRDYLLCVPEVEVDILGATAEEAALNYFRQGSSADSKEVSISRINSPGEFVPSVETFLVGSPNQEVKMKIGVAPIDEHPRCRGWSLAYSGPEDYEFPETK